MNSRTAPPAQKPTSTLTPPPPRRSPSRFVIAVFATVSTQTGVTTSCVSDRSADQTLEADSISNAEARTIIDKVVAAAGGRENLNAIRTLAVQYVHTVMAEPGAGDRQSTTPQTVDVMQLRDFENGRHLYEVYSGGDTETWERIVILPGGTFFVDRVTNRWTPVAASALAGAQYGGIQLRWYVYAALTEATMAGPNLRHSRDTTVNGRSVHVITYPGVDIETIELWIDAESGLIQQRQLHASDPILGSANVRLEFGDYRIIGGIPIPMEVAFYTNDRLSEQFVFQEIRMNAEIQEDAFVPPVQ